jgi:ketosteroid isomerase-like protein
MMSNLELAKELYAGFARGDIPTVMAGFQPAIEWREAEGNPYQLDGAAWVGPKAVLERLLTSLGSDWEGFAVTVRTVHDAGKSLDAQMCHVLRFRDGKLSSFQHSA